MSDVPRECYYIGAAGVIPYLATSLSTVYLAYDINHAHYTGSGVLLSPETAHQLLAIIEPIQIGYGAVVSSYKTYNISIQKMAANVCDRSSPSLAPSIGDWNMPDMVVTIVIKDMPSE